MAWILVDASAALAFEGNTITSIQRIGVVDLQIDEEKK
jgi:hypothetical protein